MGPAYCDGERVTVVPVTSCAGMAESLFKTVGLREDRRHCVLSTRQHSRRRIPSQEDVHDPP
ncbi:hypothetical protein, partial [Streptomyces sp. NK15101]|uniref:hypothetical protein n=1 Tax=Streptomyces sp. NK15101 TaxID=2873261 RepID=UPI001CEC3522